MPERRFTEVEATEIFRLAANAEEQSAATVGGGLTLDQLKAIGREAGLDPDLVAQAAASLNQSVNGSGRRFLGFPIGVSHLVDLDHPLSDDQWERLVSKLRDTFEAKGSIRYDGPFRQWSNGNLHITVEPHGRGHRVRFQTSNGAARSLMTAGLASLVSGTTVTALMALTGRITELGALLGPAFLSSVGVAFFALGALRLPTWFKLRRSQMVRLGAWLEDGGDHDRSNSIE